MKRVLLGVAVALFLLAACYKGDPGYGITDYPPERARDAGRE